MIQTTENIGLFKPDSTEFFNISHQNENMDKIDAEFGKKMNIPDGGSAGQSLRCGKNGGEAVWDDLTADDVGAVPKDGGDLTGGIRLPSKGGNWITGAAITNASIGISNKNSDTGYHPIIAGQTKGNHVWNIGTLMDRMGFYGFRAGRTENARDWAFDIDVYTGAVSSTGAITAPSFNGVAEFASKIKDAGDNRDITIAYGKAGMSSATYIAAWNGSELRAILPGNITSGYASALTTSAGSASQPVYFSNGKPVVCTSITAASATKATQDGDGNVIKDTYIKKSDDSIVIGNGASTASGGVAIGYHANASTNAVAILGSASGYGNLAIGKGATASNDATIAIGKASASGVGAISIGENAYTHGDYAVTVGQYAKSIEYSAAIGYSTNAAGSYSTAVGCFASANGNYSSSFGRTAQANGVFSTSLGSNTSAGGNYSTAIGHEARIPSTDSHTIRLGDNSVSSLKCKVTITPYSDERDKTDIEQVNSSVMEFLEKIHAVRYVFNIRGNYIDMENLSDDDREKLDTYGICSYDREAHARGEKKGERKRIGFLAQEVQGALEESFGDASYFNLVNDNLHDLNPETIPDDVESQLTMNYEGFIPIIIKGMQELSGRIKELERKSEA